MEKQEAVEDDFCSNMLFKMCVASTDRGVGSESPPSLHCMEAEVAAQSSKCYLWACPLVREHSSQGYGMQKLRLGNQPKETGIWASCLHLFLCLYNEEDSLFLIGLLLRGLQMKFGGSRSSEGCKSPPQGYVSREQLLWEWGLFSRATCKSGGAFYGCSLWSCHLC